MNDRVAQYGKEVMVVEVGMSCDGPTATTFFINDLNTKTKSVSGGNGTDDLLGATSLQ